MHSLTLIKAGVQRRFFGRCIQCFNSWIQNTWNTCVNNYIKCYAYFIPLVWMFVRNWFTMEMYSQLYFVLLGILSAFFVFRECVSVMFSLLAVVVKLIELHFFIGYFYMKLYLALLTSVKYVIAYFIILIFIHVLFYLF